MMSGSRKRRRSDEGDFGLQTKYFVNQQLIDKSNKERMEKVYEKTLGMIFAGAKIQNRKEESKSNNNESILDTVDDKLPEHRGGCMLCWRDIETSPNFFCTNCNLRVCGNCNMNCCGCNVCLCCNCVKIFNCMFADRPICDSCKFYVNQ